MRRAALALVAVLALAACSAGGGPRMGKGMRFKPTADPGEVVATELAFARAAREKGQWTAFAEFAAKDAVMFAPEPVDAQGWLKGRANPVKPVEWNAYQVWSSCDGSLAVTRGGWTRPDGMYGSYVTIWERQKDGTYRWVLDHGETLAEPLPEPEMVQAQIADCGKKAPDIIYNSTTRRSPPSYHWETSSADGTLTAEVDLREGYQGNLVFSFAQEDGQSIPAVRINRDPE